MATRTQTPEDAAVLEDTKKQLEAGGDPFGDNEEIVAESIDDQAAAAQAKLDRKNGVTKDDKGGEGADGEGSDTDVDAATATATEGDAAKDKAATTTGDDTGAEGDAAAAEETAAAVEDEDEDDDASLEPQGYRGTPVHELEAKSAEIDGKVAAEFKKLMAGDIDDEAYSKAIAPLQAEQRKLTKEVARAEAIIDRVAEYQGGVVQAVAKQAVKDGIVYIAPINAKPEVQKAAAKASKQYDAVLNALTQDPDNARRSFKSMAKEAHAAVLAMHGITKAKTTTTPAKTTAAAAAPAAPADKPPARQPPKVAVPTLREIPAAAQANGAGTSLAEQGKLLKGAAYEAWFGKLTPSQKASLLDE